MGDFYQFWKALVPSAVLLFLLYNAFNSVHGIAPQIGTPAVVTVTHTDTQTATKTVYVEDSTLSPIIIPENITELAQYYIDEYTTDHCLFSPEELFEHAVFFAETFLYPNNVAQAKMINSTFFAEDVKGRIDVTRNYEGRELNTEYIFGLFVNIQENPDFNGDGKPDVTNIFGYGHSYEIYQFAGNCDQYSFSLIMNATFPSFNNMTIPFEADFFFKLNANKEVQQYDLKFSRWPAFFDKLLKLAYAGISQTAPLNSTETLSDESLYAVQELLAQSVCNVHQEYCKGDNIQYESAEYCYDYLTNHTRLGTSYEGGRNTVMCRSLHQNMIAWRPEVHCPHIGPSGGDMCLDDDLSEYDNVIFNFNSTFPEKWIIFDGEKK